MVIKKYQEEIDWDVIVKRAAAWQAQKVVALTFHLLEEFFDLPVPIEINDKRFVDPIPLPLLDQARKQIRLSEQIGHVVTPDLANLSAIKGLFGKLRLIFSRVFLPKLVIARIYNVNPKSLRIYLYYPVRLLDLWRHYRNAVKKIVREDQGILEGVVQTQSKSWLRAWLTSEK